MKGLDLAKLTSRLDQIQINSNFGRITRVIGLIIESQGPEVSIGELCLIKNGHHLVRAEVVGFDNNRVLLMPLGEMDGITPGARVIATGEQLMVKVGEDLLGKVVDGLGKPIYHQGPLPGLVDVKVKASPPAPLTRQRITRPLSLGVRSIDGLLTCGRGQRVGIFSGSGVGKSTLMGMAARNTAADINVIGLVGERGREVREFLERDLGEQALARSVVVVATSDQPALVRVKAAYVTTAIAEYFRNQGHDVLLMMDSITRVAMAWREVGLTVGEPPATRGYPPSVFAELPKLLERTGTNQHGSITALYTVLVEGDDFNEPISDAVRGILDGHILLSRELADRNHYPAVDVLGSVSRVMPEVTEQAHLAATGEFKKLLADYRASEDLINIGAYQPGSNPAVDRAINKIKEINDFLRQDMTESSALDETINRLKEIVS